MPNEPSIGINIHQIISLLMFETVANLIVNK
jgi:hypothetical protein